MPRTTFDNTVKAMLEDIFEMSGGYVMDFTNASFASFIEPWIGIDPYKALPGFQGRHAARNLGQRTN